MGEGCLLEKPHTSKTCFPVTRFVSVIAQPRQHDAVLLRTSGRGTCSLYFEESAGGYVYGRLPTQV
jgi:hypothetical protein